MPTEQYHEPPGELPAEVRTFVFDCGQDVAIGYIVVGVAEWVRLYLVESFSFRVATPEAAVSLPAAAA